MSAENEKSQVQTQMLKRLFGVNARALQMNLEGFTDKDAFIQPPKGGNCANWVLGHIVQSRIMILKLIGGEQVWEGETGSIYARGSKELQSEDGTFPIKRLLEDFAASQENIGAALDRLTDEELLKEADGKMLQEKLSFFYFHEGYHLGQLGLLRRMAGKGGAI
jgi:uncharacterized damage-inducible protein DinB